MADSLQPPGCSVCEIFQVRILERVALPSSAHPWSSRCQSSLPFSGWIIFHCVHGPHCYAHPSIHPSMHLPNHPSIIYPSINHPLSTHHPSIIHPSIHTSTHPASQPASHRWALRLHLTLGSCEQCCCVHKCTNKCPSSHLCIYPTIHPSSNHPLSTHHPSIIHQSTHPFIHLSIHHVSIHPSTIPAASHRRALGLHLTLGSCE